MDPLKLARDFDNFFYNVVNAAIYPVSC